MTRQEFGRRFQRAREDAGFSQDEAATLLDVAQPRIAEYESGVRVPPTLKLVEIVHTLGLDATILFPEFFPID
jgi:transcriptional regulator with XRE-family HTH domain